MSKFFKNPLLDNIIVHYDKHGDNPKKFVLPAGEITEIEDKYAEHVQRAVYNEVVNIRGLNGVKLNADPEKKKELLEEIVTEV